MGCTIHKKFAKLLFGRPNKIGCRKLFIQIIILFDIIVIYGDRATMKYYITHIQYLLNVINCYQKKSFVCFNITYNNNTYRIVCLQSLINIYNMYID